MYVNLEWEMEKVFKIMVLDLLKLKKKEYIIFTLFLS